MSWGKQNRDTDLFNCDLFNPTFAFSCYKFIFVYSEMIFDVKVL